MMKKGRTFLWTDDCQAAFEQFKEALSTPPILAMPDENAQYVLDTTPVTILSEPCYPKSKTVVKK